MTSRPSLHPIADAILDAPGLACISLTPLVKTTIRDMVIGAVLEVRTDDPAAREGIPSWCRLTRNTLLDSVEHDAIRTTFSIQHTPNNNQKAATS
jgi:tRNA 2-thiouridine synthesizing protein A